MAFDLDNKELRAIRRDKGLDKERSDKDVEQLKDLILDRQSFLIDEKEHDEIFLKDIKAIENILAEREQDKKRIHELEEENKKYIVKLTDEQYKKLVDSIRKEVKQEFEQKVKDKMEELKQLKVQLPVQHMKEAQIIVLQELLRGEEDNGT